MRNSHRFWGRLEHAIHLQSLSAGRIRWIEHGSRDQRLEEVAMDVEVLQHRLLEKRLEVEAGLVAVDVRIAVQRQDGADVRVLEFD